MSDAALVSNRVSIWQHAASAVLILVFIAAGALRLNECDLFNPDSPRYLIYARGLVQTGEYRAIDLPGEPYYTWRPPGLPMLLAPALMLRPYDVVAAKVVVLALAALLLLAVHALASRTGGGWSGPAMVAVVASSPIFLVLSTEVLTEIPYALGTLAVLYWLGRSSQSDPLTLTLSPADGGEGTGLGSTLCNSCNALRFAAVLIALAFLPFVRTVAVSLVAAVGLWSLASRRRWPYVIAVGVAIAGIVWQAQRGDSSSGDNYAGSLLSTIHERGLFSVAIEAANTLVYYASTVPDVLLPGLTTGRPFYAPLLVDAPQNLSIPEPMSVGVTCIVMLFGVAGMWSLRRGAGGPALLYLPLYAACLAIWPWRHERFVWVLVPLMWAFVPAGLTVLSRALPAGSRAAMGSLAGLCLLALCVCQTMTDFHLIATNQRFHSQGDAFNAEAAPSFYFSDFRKAGEWIRDHTPEHARVLTWHAAVAGTAHRYQKRVAFETKTPEQIRQQMQAFSARYLVVPTAQFDDGFGWQQVGGDPGSTFTVVYRERGVAVLAIEPNRTGEISRTAYDECLRTRLADLDAYLQQHPQRTDLIARRATLLSELGRTDEAIDDLRGLVDRGVVTVRVCANLGWLLLEEEQYADAARYLDLARGLPNAESIASALADGVRYAHERSRTPPNPPSLRGGEDFAPPAKGGLGGGLEPASADDIATIARELRRVQGHVAALKWTAAERSAERLIEIAPDHPGANYWHGYVHHLFGELDHAAARYERAVQLGSQDARGKLRLLRWSAAMANGQPATIMVGERSESVDPSSIAAHIRLAKLFNEHGWPGRAVATLEAAHKRFGDDSAILVRLADLYRQFAQPENASPLYRLVLERTPHDTAAQDGLEAAEAALRRPRF